MNTSPPPHDAAESHYLALNPHLRDTSECGIRNAECGMNASADDSEPSIPNFVLPIPPQRAFHTPHSAFPIPHSNPPKTLCLADLPRQDVDWLWPGRIPIGKVTLLVGDPGVGKSLVALDIAARVTRGAPWPDAFECGVANGEGGMNAAAAPHSALPIPHSPFHIPHSRLRPPSLRRRRPGRHRSAASRSRRRRLLAHRSLPYVDPFLRNGNCRPARARRRL